MQRDLRRLGVKVVTERMLEEVGEARPSPRMCGCPRIARSNAFDTLVISSARISNDEMYVELRAEPERLAEAGIEGLFVTGSAAAPGMLVDSIFQAHRLAARSTQPIRPSRCRSSASAGCGE